MDRLVTPLVNPPVPPVDPWVHDTSHNGQVPKCPRSEIAYGTKNTSYIWNTVESCKSANEPATAPTTAASSPTTAAASPTSGDTAPTTAASSPTTAATAPTTAAAPTATRTEVS